MLVSRVHSGRLIVILSKDELKLVPGPYRLEVNQPGTITLARDPNGNRGTRDVTGGGQRLEFINGYTRMLKPFGRVDLQVAGHTEGLMWASLPDALPAARDARQRKPKVKPVAVVNNLTVAATSLSLPELIRQINAARDACPNNMVFSTDAEGFLRVTVEYGRS